MWFKVVSIMTYVGEDIQHFIMNQLPSESALLTDIRDGKLYKSLVESGHIRVGSTITLTFNTDGIPVFKSSKSSFWPIFLTVNELPYKIR